MQVGEEIGVSMWFETMWQVFRPVAEEATVYWAIVMTAARLALSDLVGNKTGRSEVRRILDNRVRSSRQA